MEMQLSSSVIVFVILAVVLVVVAILIFNYRNPTQAEKDANRNRLYVGIGIGLLALTGGFLLYTGGFNAKEMVEGTVEGGEGEYGWGYKQKTGMRGQEYGFREAFSEWREQRKNVSQAKKSAKAQGLSREEVDAKVRSAKNDYRQMKQAGQEAKRGARQAYRDAQVSKTNV